MPNILPFIFERADKLLLLAAPYLVTVSILYYAGYWGVLGVDVYNYFAVSDLIKGAAYPIQLALAVAIVAAVADWFFSYVGLIAVRRKKKPALVLFAVVVFIGLVATVVWQSGSIILDLLHGKPISGLAGAMLPLLNVPVYIGVLVVLLGWWATDKVLPMPSISARDKSRLKGFRLEPVQFKKPRTVLRLLVLLNKFPERYLAAHFQRFALALALLTTPFFSFASGYYKAQNVLAGRRFDYVERQVYQEDKLLVGYSFLKYLGRVGDYHFLLTPDNQRRIIVGKDRWPALLLRSFKAAPVPNSAKNSISKKPA